MGLVLADQIGNAGRKATPATASLTALSLAFLAVGQPEDPQAFILIVGVDVSSGIHQEVLRLTHQRADWLGAVAPNRWWRQEAPPLARQPAVRRIRASKPDTSGPHGDHIHRA